MKTVNEFCVSNGAQRLSDRLQTKWLWNRFLLQLLKPQNCACFDQGASDIQATTECTFTLKLVCDMIRTQLKNFLPVSPGFIK